MLIYDQKILFRKPEEKVRLCCQIVIFSEISRNVRSNREMLHKCSLFGVLTVEKFKF